MHAENMPNDIIDLCLQTFKNSLSEVFILFLRRIANNTFYFKDQYIYKILKKLLNYDIDPNIKDDIGLPPLFYIGNIEYNQYEIVEMLLAKGADPYFVSNRGRNPLDNYLLSGKYIRTPVVDILAYYTPDINYKSTLLAYSKRLRNEKGLNKNITYGRILNSQRRK